MARRPSLKRPLIVKTLIYQLLALLVAFFALLMVLIRADSGGYYTIQTFAPVAADAVHRDRNGDLYVQNTPELAELLKVVPVHGSSPRMSTATTLRSGLCRRPMPRWLAHWMASPLATCAGATAAMAWPSWSASTAGRPAS